MKNRLFMISLFLFLFLFLFPFPIYGIEVNINHILIKGNLSFTRKRILKVMQVAEKKSYDSEHIRESVKNLEKYYHIKGYTICKINGYVDLESNLKINIKEGIIKEVIFLRLGYLKAFLVRQEFGSHRNKIFYKPLVDAKLNMIANITRTAVFDYEFIPVENLTGYYYLYLKPKTRKKEKVEGRELEPYTDFYFNFRGWFLSLVPYVNITFYNIGKIDHSIRLNIDYRFATAKWFEFTLEGLEDSVVNQYHELDYFSVPFYKDLRFHFNTGILINRQGRGDLGAKFKTIRFPFLLGIGFDFKYFWTSISGGYIYEKLRNIELETDTLVTIDTYPELTSERNIGYTRFSAGFTYVDEKKYVNERDDVIKIGLNYTFNKDYKWISAQLRGTKIFMSGYDVFFIRYRAFFMSGDYPIYFLFGLPSEFYLRGYWEIHTDRAIDGGLEVWNSVYEDYIHSVFFFDTGWFHNLTFKDHFNMGDFLFNYGLGMSFSYQELNLRFLYAVPLKRRADRGRLDFFFRMRF